MTSEARLCTVRRPILWAACSGPVLSGQFSGPVSMGGEAIDMRGSTGAIYKPTGPVRQHFGDKIEIHGDGNVIGSGSAAVLKGANMERFLKDLQSLRQALQDANLDDETVQAVDADLQTVQAQAGKERPNKTMIMSKLRSASGDPGGSGRIGWHDRASASFSFKPAQLCRKAVRLDLSHSY